MQTLRATLSSQKLSAKSLSHICSNPSQHAACTSPLCRSYPANNSSEPRPVSNTCSCIISKTQYITQPTPTETGSLFPVIEITFFTNTSTSSKSIILTLMDQSIISATVCAARTSLESAKPTVYKVNSLSSFSLR